MVKLCCHTWPVKYVLPPTESQLSLLGQSSPVSSMREVGPNSFRQVMGISLVTTPITGRGEGVEIGAYPPFVKRKQRQFLFCDQPTLSDLCHLQSLSTRNICDVCGTVKGLSGNQDYQAAVYQRPEWLTMRNQHQKGEPECFKEKNECVGRTVSRAGRQLNFWLL